MKLLVAVLILNLCTGAFCFRKMKAPKKFAKADKTFHIKDVGVLGFSKKRAQITLLRRNSGLQFGIHQVKTNKTVSLHYSLKISAVF